MVLFKNKKTSAWFITTVVLVVFFAVVTILSTTVFYKTFNTVLPGGGERAVYADGVEPRYISDYEDKQDALEKSNEFNVTLNEEGIVLLKNEDNALPIYTPASGDKAVSENPKISVFGKNSVNMVHSVRTGSGAGSSPTMRSAGVFSDVQTRREGPPRTARALSTRRAKPGCRIRSGRPFA